LRDPREPITRDEDEVALFRYGLIADLLHLKPEERQLSARLREKADREYTIPGRRSRRVAAETIRDWLQLYDKGGFEALRPRPRSDRGKLRVVDQATADLLCSIKEGSPELTVAGVIAKAYSAGAKHDPPLALSTVHRLLSRHGLMKRPAEEGTSKDRRRFSYEHANELWMSDVMYGPAVTIDGRRKHRSYLIAFLDDATRVVPFAAFTFSENVSAFLPVLEQGIRRRGIPQRLYVDNGSAFRSHHLALVCAKLGVSLIHARPYQPQGKGKLERWFRTIRMQFLPRLNEDDLASLAALNRRLWAWIEGEYHQTPHRGLDDETPFDHWARRSERLHLAGPELADMFLFEQRRRVQKDRTVSLLGVAYEVDASLVGETVTLRYDPSRPGSPIDVVFGNRSFMGVKPVDAYANCFVRRDHGSKLLEPATPPAKPRPGLRLRELKER
jgi:transposase InsO family protein